MNRLERYFNGVVDHPEDVDMLIREIPELQTALRRCVEDLYRDYSAEQWSAGWLNGPDFDGPDVDGFRTWLLEEL